MSEMTAAERFRAATSDKQVEFEIVDLHAPSGMVYKFRKPDRMGMIFGLGNVPLAATSRAIEAWQKDGIIERPSGSPEVIAEQDKLRLFEIALRTRDRVIELSHSPKLVMGVANEANDELSTDEIEQRFPHDLTFLYEWVQSGGTKSTTLANFPDRREPNALASSVRKKHGAKT